MMFRVQSASQNTIPRFSIRCPKCHQLGVAESIGGTDWHTEPEKLFVGYRRCPNETCQTLMFIVFKDRVLASYPAERIDFDATSVPQNVLSALEEAITCHANSCFIAAAIMIRKTLEELCRDRNAQGGNLKERIRALGAKVILPSELFAGLDDLRLLGNDAAHVESTEYNQIGQPEVEVAIEFTKEILKAIYQYAVLLARIQGLKKLTPP